MSGLYPDASYCTSDIGRLLFQPKVECSGTVTVVRIVETKAIAGTHNDYILEFKLVSNDILNSDPRIFHITSRFRELNRLHAALAKTHKQLYLRGTFPSYPAPKIIGSGDPAVLAERRRATEVFLNFVLESEVLRKSCTLHEFLDKAQEQVMTASNALADEELYSTIPSSADPVGNIIEEQPFSDIFTPSGSTSAENQDFLFPEIALGNPTEHSHRKSSAKRPFPKLRIDLNASERDPNNYLVKAGILVSTAKKAEQEKEFELAFQCYKNAARSLAEGVRTESDSVLRNAVKRKTALYIVRAEELFKMYLSYDGSTINLDGLLSGSSHLQDPNIFAFKSANSALKNYDIVTVLPNVNSSIPVLLMEEKSSGSKFVLKMIAKGKEDHGRVLLPTDVPHMVQLHKFFETENYILLLVDHATNGRLFDFLGYGEKRHKRKRRANKSCLGDELSRYSYSGKKMHFSVGFDIERVVAMRDEQQSTDDPSTYEVSCAIGEDCASEVTGPSGEFYMPKETQSGMIHGCEEMPAAVLFAPKQAVSKNLPKVSLSSSLAEVRELLTNRKHWPKGTSLPEVLVVHWTAQIASFMYIMHMHHGEYLGYLNPSNILMDVNGNVLLTYHAEWYSSEYSCKPCSKYTDSECSKVGWKPTAKSDVYTLGCLIFEMTTGRPFWIAAPHGITRDSELPIDDHPTISLACRDLLFRMLAPESERCTLDEVRGHAYFSGIDWHLYDNPH